MPLYMDVHDVDAIDRTPYRVLTREISRCRRPSGPNMSASSLLLGEERTRRTLFGNKKT